jgi:hypothetical protein
VIIGGGCGGCGSSGSGLDPGGGFSSPGDETSICTAISAAIFVYSIPSGNRGIGVSLFERKGQLAMLFGSCGVVELFFCRAIQSYLFITGINMWQELSAK